MPHLLLIATAWQGSTIRAQLHVPPAGRAEVTVRKSSKGEPLAFSPQVRPGFRLPQVQACCQVVAHAAALALIMLTVQ